MFPAVILKNVEAIDEAKTKTFYAGEFVTCSSVNDITGEFNVVVQGLGTFRVRSDSIAALNVSHAMTVTRVFSLDNLVPGATYLAITKLGSVEYIACRMDEGKKYVGNRVWAYPENNQVYDIYEVLFHLELPVEIKHMLRQIGDGL